MSKSKSITDIIREVIQEELLGKTRTGELHSTPDGRIRKITTDKSEYENARKLIQNPSPYFIKYYSAKPSGLGQYELIMDRVSELGDAEWETVELILNSLGTQAYMLDPNRRNSFIQELKQNPEYYEDFATLDEVLSMLKVLYSIYLDASKRGMTLYDLRAQNIGKTPTGQIVHFDIGAE